MLTYLLESELKGFGSVWQTDNVIAKAALCGINPFDTMKFQYFALISTGMSGTHVHLPIMTLIYGLKLNNRHGLKAL